jgi:exodeoxyribonuclease VIII
MQSNVSDFPEPGLYPTMPAEAYHSIEAMSSGGAKKILKSPAHYKLMRTKKNEPTPAMQFGTVTHTGVLEPHRFALSCISVPDDAPKRPTSAQRNARKPSLETLESIDFWEGFDKASAGRIVLSASDFARARRTIDAVLSHRGARALLDGATVEESVFWRDERYGVPCKARFDARNHGGLIDLKSTQDASPEDFARDAAKYLYHSQAAHYSYGAEATFGKTPEFFAFIAAETDEPHGVACYALPENALHMGRHLMARAMGRYAHALSVGEFQSYPDTIETLRLPAYALKFDV